jgi:UDP-N-acetylmuramoylalanine--D-glutamate ligase
MERVLVYGMAQAGRAVAAACRSRGIDVVTADDRPVDGATHVAPRGEDLAALVRSVDTVLPAPGVPEHHPVIVEAVAQGRSLRTELDLAAEWESSRPGGPRPFLAITGTDGKTTTTTLTLEVLRASGVRAVDAGNNDLPLVTAIDDASTEVFVVEASSFRLRWITRFAPHVGTWINLAPDHLDWHGDIERYAAAKARIWELQGPGDIAVANAEDATVMAARPASAPPWSPSAGRAAARTGGSRPVIWWDRTGRSQRWATCGARCPTTSRTHSPPWPRRFPAAPRSRVPTLRCGPSEE